MVATFPFTAHCILYQYCTVNTFLSPVIELYNDVNLLLDEGMPLKKGLKSRSTENLSRNQISNSKLDKHRSSFKQKGKEGRLEWSTSSDHKWLSMNLNSGFYGYNLHHSYLWPQRLHIFDQCLSMIWTAPRAVQPLNWNLPIRWEPNL